MILVFATFIGGTCYFDNKTPQKNSSFETFLAVSIRCIPYGASAVCIVTALLISTEAYLIVILCRYFRKEMSREIFFLFFVQFFFVVGFMFRAIIECQQWRSYNQDHDLEEAEIDKHRLMWNVHYFVYEGLPILAVYFHHVLNFRNQSKQASSSTQL